MKQQVPNVRPLSIWQSLMLVLLPAVPAALLIHLLVPVMVRQYSIPFLFAYLPWWIGFETLFLVAAFVAYRLEGNPPTWAQFACRYRLRRMKGQDWLWFAALLTTFVLVAIGLSVWGKELSSLPGLPVSTAFPAELNPSNPTGMIAGEFMGAPLRGQWWIAALYFIGWVLNIFGEEFWYRGYMLPRQEAAYGKWAWGVHGLIWALHHVWQVWTLVLLLPYSFLWSFIIQRGKNTWIPIVVHGLANLVPLGMIVVGVIS